jgi:hypothetical protein
MRVAGIPGSKETVKPRRSYYGGKAVMVVCFLVTMIFAVPCGGDVGVFDDKGGAVLILNSYHLGYEWSDGEQAGIMDVFHERDRDWKPVVEYLDLKRFSDGRHIEALKQGTKDI